MVEKIWRFGGRTQRMGSLIRETETGAEGSHLEKKKHRWSPGLRATKGASWRLRGIGHTQKRKTLAKASEP